MMKIAESHCGKAHLSEVVKKAKNLNEKWQEQLCDLLTKCEDLFDGALGEWNLPGVKIDPKENVNHIMPNCAWFHVRGWRCLKRKQTN